MLAEMDLKKRRSDFYFDLAVALEDHVPLFTTLRKYEARARRRNPQAAPMYQAMLQRSRNGSLSEALAGIMPSSDLVIINAIESAGDTSMAEGLYFLSGTVDKIEALKRAVRKAIAYPSMLLVLFAAMLYGFSFYVLPIMETLLTVDKWPWIGQLVHSMANAVQHYGQWLLLFLFGLLSLFIWALPRWQSGIRRKFDRYLPFSVYRDYHGAMVLISLSTLLRSGVSLRSALERCYKYGTPWMRWHLRQVMRNLSSADGQKFGNAFTTGFLSPVLEDRVQDAAERRDPIKSFVRIGVGSIDRLVLLIQDGAGKMNTALIIICGLILCVMMAGFFMTAMSLHQGIQ